ncbi:hypothetical protein CDD81_8065 [Ophiocordyceps australis]|uniref:Uncharacterized protein n=1 Tax=Ophiocordyceps australis TaxID=1399860 RepID=A0A2C5Y3X3_9HYPO|nr:hypothetical protein CDD81_8065 [Ophiocordyceps australis]
MDFAPYQSSPPEHSRVSSPENASSSLSPRTSAAWARSPPPLQHPQPQRAWPAAGGLDGHDSGAGWTDGSGAAAAASGHGSSPFASLAPAGAAETHMSGFDTSLGLRLDYEACLAYLALPPLGAIILLILERNSDYVRFHAWQSALLFTALMILHLIFSWSSFFNWCFFIGDIVLMAFLTMRAYKDAEVLDRFEVPFFGRVASHILDDE